MRKPGPMAMPPEDTANPRGMSARPPAALLGQRLSRAAQLLRKVLELRQAVLHAQDGALVVDVHARLEGEGRDGGGVDVDEVPLGVARHEVAAAELAPFTMAARVLVVLADVLGPLHHLHRLGLPEGEGVDRRRRPAATGLAV